jgi:hypothetical protein
MAQEKPGPFQEWWEAIRQHAPTLRDQAADAVDRARENPAGLWQIPVVRYGTYGLGVILLIWFASAVASWIAPPASSDKVPERATTADYHVLCTNPECGQHFVINRKFGFHRFPVPCPSCQQKTGEQAWMCNSPSCAGRWVVPIESDGEMICPECGQPFPEPD